MKLCIAHFKQEELSITTKEWFSHFEIYVKHPTLGLIYITRVVLKKKLSKPLQRLECLDEFVKSDYYEQHVKQAVKAYNKKFDKMVALVETRII